MRKINFNQPVLSLKNEPMIVDKEPMNIKYIVANLLSTSKAEKSAIRQLDLALRIYNSEKEINIEDADYEIIKKIIEKSGISTLISGRILKVMEGADKK